MKLKIITLILMLTITKIFSQEYYIELKNGYKTKTEKLRYVNNNKIIAFQDVNGIHKVKRNEVKIIKPTKLPKDKFVYNQLGLTPFVVVEFDSIPKKELYRLIKNWIKEKYKNPDKVIKAEIDNKKIRFEGYTDSDISIRGLGNDIYGGYNYTIVISVKDNKYKFEPIELNSISGLENYSVPLRDGSKYFNNIGIPRNTFVKFVKQVGQLFEDLNQSLKNYIIKNYGKKDNNDDDW